jgi:hypothetical protein
MPRVASGFTAGKVGLKANNSYSESDLDLWRKYKQGNQQAKWDLLQRFHGVIIANARKLSNVRPYSVVEAELKEITLKSFDTYTPAKGAKLSTYVINNFKKVSRENINNQHAIRIPENVHFKFKPITEANEYLTEALNREPTYQEVAEYTGWSLPKVIDASTRLRRELVESKQTFEPGVSELDPTQQAFFYAYNVLDNQGKYILEHSTGYGGKKELPDSKIRVDLKLSPHLYNKKKNEVVSVMRESLNVAQEGY